MFHVGPHDCPPKGGTEASAGVVTGMSFRRLVAKTFARQFDQEVEAVCVPQFASSTRAGTDYVGHAVRAETEANPQATRVCIAAP